MSARTYLSIGDVLSLLREEFPDVTISKIRFLESQGLVNPERSPSGYRKFYEGDVERLRWVLRQQREHFLPLKVIRDRLDREGDAVHHMADAAALPPTATSATGVLGPRPLPEPNGESSPPQGNGGLRAPRADEAAVAHAVGIAGPVAEPTSRGARHEPVGVGADTASSRHPSAGSATAEATSVRALASDRPKVAASDRPLPPVSQVPAGVTPAVPAPDQPPRPSPRREPAPAAHGEPAGTRDHESGVGPAGGPTGVGRADADRQTTGGGPGTTGVTPAEVSGASFTLEELCAASGLPVTEVAALEGFGLVEPMSVAGVLYYDEEALVVAKLVASYRRYGIEPRHLRLYRNAVDREMGLVEQIVTPLLRQRNPEARQRAADAAGELAKLGQQLRSSLLRREIRHQLGR